MKTIHSRLSRRKLVQGFAALAGAVGLTPGTTMLSRAEQSGGGSSPRALALIGDRYHNADYIRVALDKTFGELDMPVDYTIHYEKISSNMLKGYQLFLVLRDGMIWPDGYLGPDAYTDYERNLENLPPRSEDPSHGCG